MINLGLCHVFQISLPLLCNDALRRQAKDEESAVANESVVLPSSYCKSGVKEGREIRAKAFEAWCSKLKHGVRMCWWAVGRQREGLMECLIYGDVCAPNIP